MIRKVKMLGMALVAMLAFGAMTSAAASAADFTTGEDTVTLTAGQVKEHVLSVTGLEVKCTDVEFHGHVTAPTTTVSSVTVDPTYTGCTGGGLNARVTGFDHWPEETGGCDYVLHAAGTADLVCDPGDEVTIHAGTCSVHIPPQTGLKTITYKNEGTSPNEDILLEINLTNITGFHTDGFLCPFNGSGHFTNGILTGTSTVKGEDSEGNPVDITWDA